MYTAYSSPEHSVGGEVPVGLEAAAGGVEAVAVRVCAGVGRDAAVRRDAADPVGNEAV